jgi:branched-chain amino acid transport system ATP-binding protein
VRALLEVRQVTAGYGKGVDILQDVSLEVAESEVVGVIGLNGAGKSTLMKVICGFVAPRAGRILFDGEDITAAASHTMIDRGLWMIPQESSLFPYLSVEDNLRLPMEHLRRRGGRPSKAEQRARLADLWQRFPFLTGKLKSQAGNLSGGQQKIVEFGKALLIQPRLCLIDEPSIGIAPNIAEQIYSLIEVFAARGTAIVLIDHNVRRVIAMAATTYVLTLGRVTARGGREEFEASLHIHARQWLGLAG